MESWEGLAWQVQRVILDRHAAGRHVVILVDEAQVMPNESLEVLRLLTNLETQDAKLVQVVLFAQPGQETAFSRMEDLVFEESTGAMN